jgi:VanZ family protein
MSSSLRLIVVHLVSVLLVVGYTNTSEVWRFLGTVVSRELRDAIPFLIVGFIITAIAVYVLFNLRTQRVTIGWHWLAAALVWALIGLASTDPMFPAKRIHVPQYAFLCCVLWFSIRTAERTRWTLLLVFCAAALYGVHDEFLQGLHPRRTFGLRDMLTDFSGAAAGAFLVRAFVRVPSAERMARDQDRTGALLRNGLLMLLLGVVLLAGGSVGFRFELVPYWTILPLLAAAFVVAFMAERLEAPGDRLAMRAIVAVSLLFALYPLVINVALLDFA